MSEIADLIVPLAGIVMITVISLTAIKYRHERRAHKTGRHGAVAPEMNEEERATLEDLARIAERMDRRLEALEKILEAEDPKWKERVQ